MKRLLMPALAVLILALPAAAEIVRIDCIGSVEYNQISSGVFGPVSSGDAVMATFTVDSDDYVDSTNFGVRSYPIILESFELTIGSVGPVPLVIPQPDGQTSYFNLRNADPVADGFFVANNPEFPSSFPALDVPAQIDPYFGFHWEVGYTGDTLGSRDILDALGTYDYTGLTSFYTVIADAFADAMGLEYVSMVISTDSVATEAASWSGVKALFD
ncbi:MAG: hypothetical protein R3D98_00365 [Candidatus Krumholzibacteriia bacterium]